MMDKIELNNPADNKSIKKSTLRFIFSKTISKIINSNIKSAVTYFYASGLNYLNERNRKNNFYCNVCNKKTPYFPHKPNKTNISYYSRCPNCDSRKRHRGLMQIYKNELKQFDQKTKILHFAPEQVFYDLLSDYAYTTTDKYMAGVDLKLDLDNMDNKYYNSFDLILCNHVLEHIRDDEKALSSICNLLKSNGKFILSIPGDWEMDKTVEYEEVDWNGHYRNYGLDIINKLKNHFDEVKSIDTYIFNNDFDLELGLTKNFDLIFICEKIST